MEEARVARLALLFFCFRRMTGLRTGRYMCYLRFLTMSTTSLSPALFRSVMGSFPTGVTVVTAESEPGKVHGMTANSLTAVSLDPLLILICVDQKARMLGYLKAQRR